MDTAVQRLKLLGVTRIANATFAVAFLNPCCTLAADVSFPSRPVRFIIPAPPGGTVDHVARLIATPLTEQMGKPFVLDNRAGAGGVIAAELIANAVPDGHTLGMIYTSYTTNAVLRAKASYSPTRDNTPITQATASPLVLVAHTGLALKTAGELVTLAKKKPLLQYVVKLLKLLKVVKLKFGVTENKPVRFCTLMIALMQLQNYCVLINQVPITLDPKK